MSPFRVAVLLALLLLPAAVSAQDTSSSRHHQVPVVGRIPGKAWATFDLVLTPAGGHAWKWTRDGESLIGETLRGESNSETTAKLATRLLDRLVRYTITP